MERQAFVEIGPEPWWLQQRDLDYRLVELRLELGTTHFAWNDPEWYLDTVHLDELYRYLESSQPQLLHELDEAIDAEQRLQWLLRVRDLRKQPAESGPAQQAETTVAAQAAPEVPQAKADPRVEMAPSWDESWQMLYRVDADGNYQLAFSDDQRTVRPGSAWMSPGEATAAKQAATQAPAPSEAAVAAVAPAAASPDPPASWDKTWGMFLRYVDGKYEYALSNVLGDAPGTDTPTGQPDGNWQPTAEAAGQARQQAAAATANVTELLANPDDPVSQEALDAALTTPGFQQMMEEAQAELEAELAAADDEG